MSEYTDQATRRLLAVTRDGRGTVDKARVRQLMAEAWSLGWMARADPRAAEVNPFLTPAYIPEDASA